MPSVCKAAFATTFVLAILPVTRADQAIVIGVQEYAPLVAANNLKGCVNDAQSIGEALRQMGFKVTLLTNSNATRKRILDELSKAQASVKKTERFVFYFAGHGRKAPRFALLPSDAEINGNDLEPKDLNAAILKIPAKSRTVLLDSCFSGGMAAGEMSRAVDDGIEARFFDPVESRSITFGPAKSQGSSSNKPEILQSSPGICFYTAALDTEQALEATMDDGKRHGLFTYGLLKNLKEGKLWSEVHNDVKKQIGKRLENSGRTQNPMISTQYMSADALDNVTKGASRPPPGKTLLDVWNLDNPNTEKIALRIKPDADIQEAGKEISLETKVGQDGYLVILGQVGNRFYQFYPFEGTRGADARVRKGTLVFPSGRERLFFDTFGADHLKAMLFATPEKAEAVMAAMRNAQGQAKDVNLGKEIKDNPFTSRVSVAISDALIGGSRLKTIDGLIKKVMSQGNDPAKFLFSKLKLAAADYSKGENWMTAFDPSQQPSISDRETFICLLNLAMQQGLLYDAGAFGGVKLPDDVKKAVANPPRGEKLWQLNRTILLTLYPEEVNPDAK